MAALSITVMMRMVEIRQHFLILYLTETNRSLLMNAFWALNVYVDFCFLCRSLSLSRVRYDLCFVF